MKKIIWVDVGTHFAQEYESVFGSNLNFFWKLFRRFVGSKIFFRGGFPSLKKISRIYNFRKFLKANKDRFSCFFVEANSKIVTQKKIYLQADAVFNFALTNNSTDTVDITKLYLGNDSDVSQGSSIYLDKKNVAEDSYRLCLGVPPSKFFKALEAYLNEIKEDYVILLRLNSEGVEDDVIYAAHESFGPKLKLICGSLKDVKGVKGEKSYNDLENFMSNNNLPFIFFSEDIESWSKGHSAIKDLLL